MGLRDWEGGGGPLALSAPNCDEGAGGPEQDQAAADGEDGGGGGDGEKKQPRWRGTFLWPVAAPETLASVHIHLLASDGWC